MRSIKEIYKYGYGPSSSHTIGPTRAAEIFKSRNGSANAYQVELFGSLAATGRGHYTDKALFKILDENKTTIIWSPETILPEHTNGMQFKAFDAENKQLDQWTAFSVGGGDLIDRDGWLTPGAEVYQAETLDRILEVCRDKGFAIWEFIEYCEGKEIVDYLAGIWQIMQKSIENGLESEGVLPGPLKVARKSASYYIRAKNSSNALKSTGLSFAYALAVAEENSSGGKVVTAPTCGSAGVLPAVLYFIKHDQDISDLRIIKGLATAGLIGNLVKTNASISGAEVGCQGEIGTACAMAAAAAAQIMGGTPAQIEYAAEMGLEHNLGLTCDPVGGYVQIPCIERNAIAAGKAIECAVYALYSDGQHKVSFDQVVKTMGETGRDMQAQYRETGIGGLAKHWLNC